jgi:putative transposase
MVLRTVRNISLTREGKRWYVSFCVEGTFTLPNAGEASVGLDLGVAQSVTLSSGEALALPVASIPEENRLRCLQRRASRRAKGSVRRRQALQRLAKMRRYLANRRRDAAHKLTTRLATTHALIAVEDLKLKSMTASAAGTREAPGRNVRGKAGLNRRLLAQGHAELRRMLAYKCERSGARLVAVPPAFTSQTCSQCGYCAPENRKNPAAFLCVACGYTTHADLNAAINILAAGQAVTAQGGSGITPAGELRTHPRIRPRKRLAPTGIPAKAATTA